MTSPHARRVYQRPYRLGRLFPRSATATPRNASCSPAVNGNTTTRRSTVTSDGHLLPLTSFDR
jgi:hypothetical protein